MSFFRDLKNILTTGSRVPSGEGAAGEGVRDSDLDAAAGAEAQTAVQDLFHVAGPAYPPGYVKDYDDGRPRH